MTETTKRIIIAAVAAAVLIAGSVAVIALVDDGDDDDERERPLFALIDELDEEVEAGEFLEQLFEELFARERGADLAEGLFDLLDTLRDDLRPPPVPQPEVAPLPEEPPRPAAPDDDRPERDRDRREHRHDRELPPPGEGFEGFGLPFLEGFPLDDFLDDGHLSPEERAELEAFLRHRLDEIFDFDRFDEPFAFPPDVPPAFPDAPFGDLPLDEFLEDGRISPDEARELERLFRDRFHGVFRFEFVPPEIDRPPAPDLPDALLEGLRDIPFREFLADGELSPEEQEIVRNALNEWLDRVFERLGAP